ncbi:hypothetical protein CQW23_01941 [Capsicum baccatum]|uniref:Uncharacterized protein n=1 Tax=Capsicum baccatum TaxID=33114 RepID=A0A2G2XQ13_CAPBA|nr:hypothetical protein CQW23_01941 [Capsicum baccatum]
MYNGKSHHIRRRYNTVRELLSSEIITVDYVKLKDNMSDPLTKGLSREGVERTSKGMGLRPRTSQHDERVNGDDHSQVKCSGVNLKDVSASVRGGEVEYRDDFVRANVTEDKLDDGTTYDKSKEASTNDDANQESAKAKGVTPNDDSKKEPVCLIKKSI